MAFSTGCLQRRPVFKVARVYLWWVRLVQLVLAILNF